MENQAAWKKWTLSLQQLTDGWKVSKRRENILPILSTAACMKDISGMRSATYQSVLFHMVLSMNKYFKKAARRSIHKI